MLTSSDDKDMLALHCHGDLSLLQFIVTINYSTVYCIHAARAQDSHMEHMECHCKNIQLSRSYIVVETNQIRVRYRNVHPEIILPSQYYIM